MILLGLLAPSQKEARPVWILTGNCCLPLRVLVSRQPVYLPRCPVTFPLEPDHAPDIAKAFPQLFLKVEITSRFHFGADPR